MNRPPMREGGRPPMMNGGGQPPMMGGGRPPMMTPPAGDDKMKEEMQERAEKKIKKLRKILTDEQYDLWLTMKPEQPVPHPMPEVWGIQRSGFFNGRGKWAKGFENQMV